MKKFVTTLSIFCSLWSISQVNSFSFNVNGTVPAGFTTALNIAGQKWSEYIQVTVPIKVNVSVINTSLAPFSAITIANGRSSFTNAPVTNTLYTTALANQLAGAELNSGEFDMDIYFNLNTNYYYGTGKPPGNQSDFISTAMHEMGHGLGFYSTGYVNGSGVGSFGNIPQSVLYGLPITVPWHGQDGIPSIYDKYIIKQSGTHLVGIAPQNSNALGDSIKNNPHYFSGPLYANISHSGTPIRLSGGAGTYTMGEDLLHIHNSYANTIMSYYWGQGDTVRIPGVWELGLLREIGWQIKPVGIKENELNKLDLFYPNPANEKLVIGAHEMKSIKIYDVKGQLVREEKNARKEEIVTLNVRDLSPGIYFCKVEFINGGIVSKEVVVER